MIGLVCFDYKCHRCVAALLVDGPIVDAFEQIVHVLFDLFIGLASFKTFLEHIDFRLLGVAVELVKVYS